MGFRPGLTHKIRGLPSRGHLLGLVDGPSRATVERKPLADLVSSLTTGRLKFQLTELSAIPRAAVVVEERYSQVFKLDHARPSVVADAIAECQIRFPTVPIVFCDTRKLAQERTYRFLAAARVGLSEELVGDLAVRGPRSGAAACARSVFTGRRTTLGDDAQHRCLRQGIGFLPMTHHVECVALITR